MEINFFDSWRHIRKKFSGDYKNGKKSTSILFEPFTVRRMTMKNRIMMTPMGTNYGESSGEMSFLHINYYEQRAKGGVGLIMVVKMPA